LDFARFLMNQIKNKCKIKYKNYNKLQKNKEKMSTSTGILLVDEPKTMSIVKITLIIIIVVFVIHVIITYTKKKKCKQCSEENQKKVMYDRTVHWVGEKTKSSEPDVSTPLGSGFLPKLLTCVMSGKPLWPLPEKLELCDTCYMARKRSITKTASEQGGESIENKKTFHDPEYKWNCHPDGVRNKFREWD